MDVITNEAITELSTVVSSLLPPPPGPTLAPLVAVLPERVRPTGLGGYVGPHADPVGDVLGRQLEARVVLTVRAASPTALVAVVEDVHRALIGADAGTLRGQGVLRLAFGELGPQSVTGQGGNAVAQREVNLHVLFEHLRVPEEAGSVIESVPALVEGASTARGGRLVRSGGFTAGSLAAFEVADDPGATQGGPSQWGFDPAAGTIDQLANIRGGSFELNPNKPGTYLVLRDTPATPPLADFVASAEMRSDDVDSLGFVFRWQDVDNFYLLVLEVRRGFRMIVRKVAGVFEPLDTPAVAEVAGFVPGEVFSVRLAAQGEEFRVHLDGQPALVGRDGALPLPGRVGFGCRANEQAHFYRLDLTEL